MLTILRDGVQLYLSNDKFKKEIHSIRFFDDKGILFTMTDRAFFDLGGNVISSLVISNSDNYLQVKKEVVFTDSKIYIIQEFNNNILYIHKGILSLEKPTIDLVKAVGGDINIKLNTISRAFNLNLSIPYIPNDNVLIKKELEEVELLRDKFDKINKKQSSFNTQEEFYSNFTKQVIILNNIKELNFKILKERVRVLESIIQSRWD